VKQLIKYHNKDLKVLIEAKKALGFDIELPKPMDMQEYINKLDINKLPTKE